MTIVDSADAAPGRRREWKRALAAYAIALPIAISAEFTIRHLKPEAVPPWFDFVQSVTFLMVGIVFVYVGFLPLRRKAAKKMAWANAVLLALPYALVLVLVPIGETLTTWLILWPTATAFLVAAAVITALIVAAPGWLGSSRRRRRS